MDRANNGWRSRKSVPVRNRRLPGWLPVQLYTQGECHGLGNQRAVHGVCNGVPQGDGHHRGPGGAHEGTDMQERLARRHGEAALAQGGQHRLDPMRQIVRSRRGGTGIQDEMQRVQTAAVLGPGQRSDRRPLKTETQVPQLRQVKVFHPRLDPLLPDATQGQVQGHQLRAVVIHAPGQHGGGRDVGIRDAMHPHGQPLQRLLARFASGIPVRGDTVTPPRNRIRKVTNTSHVTNTPAEKFRCRDRSDGQLRRARRRASSAVDTHVPPGSRAGYRRRSKM